MLSPRILQSQTIPYRKETYVTRLKQEGSTSICPLAWLRFCIQSRAFFLGTYAMPACIGYPFLSYTIILEEN